MAKLKDALKNLPGGSLIEVLVASVLVLICFLLFSFVMHSVYSSRPTIPEIKLWYSVLSIDSKDLATFSRTFNGNCSSCQLSLHNDNVIIKAGSMKADILILQLYNDTIQIFPK